MKYKKIDGKKTVKKLKKEEIAEGCVMEGLIKFYISFHRK